MVDTYIIVHGAWHNGRLMEPTAEYIRSQGHIVHCPTLAGNRPNEDCSQIGLEDAISSLIQYIEQHDLNDIRLVGHSYAGMVISAVIDRIPLRIRRVVYANAFVPFPNECLNDMAPAQYKALFDPMAKANHNAVSLPFSVWRECFMNDADEALAKSTFQRLTPQPYGCFRDPIVLSKHIAAIDIAKSYLNCRLDTALPQSLSWHPRLSERLGLFRYVEANGGHETLFTDPIGFAKAIMMAARD
ncbi:alpha/beta hydrolase [Acinetobacter sp. C32I]|uniref:alpha/beta hydrolase n=1 Tax=Acinetobacter sp. C32I TaxID=2950074 RepID=UPI002036C844|nr:alpha/beta hydrolase [Acinetobacter sp. C32I]USA54348.1 alpha/beta hydrolase [Acinetobacter sp. C32I]